MDNFFKKKFLMPKVMTNMTPTTFQVASRVLSNSMTGLVAMKKVAGVLLGRSNASEYTTVVYQSYVIARYIIEAESHVRMMDSKRRPVAPSPKVKVQSYAAKRPGSPRVRVKTVDDVGLGSLKIAVANPVEVVVAKDPDREASHGVAKAGSTEKAAPVQVVKEMPAATPAPEPVAAEAVDKAEAPRQKLTIEERLNLENITEYCLYHTYKYDEVKPIYDMLFNLLCRIDDPRCLEALDQIRQRMQQLESRTIIIQSGSHVVVEQHVGSYIANVSQGAIGVKVEKD